MILLNLGQRALHHPARDRIAQIVVARCEAVQGGESKVSETSRGVGGFGTSGRSLPGGRIRVSRIRQQSGGGDEAETQEVCEDLR